MPQGTPLVPPSSSSSLPPLPLSPPSPPPHSYFPHFFRVFRLLLLLLIVLVFLPLFSLVYESMKHAFIDKNPYDRGVFVNLQVLSFSLSPAFAFFFSFSSAHRRHRGPPPPPRSVTFCIFSSPFSPSLFILSPPSSSPLGVSASERI